MNLFRYDYENIGGYLERVRKDDIYVWAVTNITTGEVDLETITQYDDELGPLVKGWEWKKFTLTLLEDKTNI